MTKEEKSLSAKGKTGDENPAKEKSTRQRGQKRDKVKPLTKVRIFPIGTKFKCKF